MAVLTMSNASWQLFLYDAAKQRCSNYDVSSAYSAWILLKRRDEVILRPDPKHTIRGTPVCDAESRVVEAIVLLTQIEC